MRRIAEPTFGKYKRHHHTIMRTLVPLRVFLFSAAVSGMLSGILATGCSGSSSSSQPPETPDPSSEPRRRSPSLDVQSEFGVLDEAKVRSTFERLWRGTMTDCQSSGGIFVFGRIVVRTRVNHSGTVKWTYLKETNLGDRDVEKCILEAVRNTKWPIPEGGEDGIAEQELPFETIAVRPPGDWAASKVQKTVSKASSSFATCRNGSVGSFVATAIINKDGTVASVGIQQPDETADDITDCMVGVIRSLSFPKTGSWPAKVSFDVP